MKYTLFILSFLTISSYAQQDPEPKKRSYISLSTGPNHTCYPIVDTRGGTRFVAGIDVMAAEALKTKKMLTVIGIGYSYKNSKRSYGYDAGGSSYTNSSTFEYGSLLLSVDLNWYSSEIRNFFIGPSVSFENLHVFHSINIYHNSNGERHAYVQEYKTPQPLFYLGLNAGRTLVRKKNFELNLTINSRLSSAVHEQYKRSPYLNTGYRTLWVNSLRIHTAFGL